MVYAATNAMRHRILGNPASRITKLVLRRAIGGALQARKVHSVSLERVHVSRFRTVFHYVSLHSPPTGRRVGRMVGDMGMTNTMSDCPLSLSIWIGEQYARKR